LALPNHTTWKGFLVLMLALAWWSFTVVMEDLSLDLSAKIFVDKKSYFGMHRNTASLVSISHWHTLKGKSG